ncbi:hypothetical protein [Pseudomonas phage D6]|nr:hypothetical protein [Pseudomonas phage D6]
MNPVARIPVLDTGKESRLLFTDGTVIEKVISCKLLDAHQQEVKDYLICNEAIIPGVYQRTIYHKGREESVKIGSLMLDIGTGHYFLKLENPMHRPAGVDLYLSIQPKESTCPTSSSESSQSTKAVA